MKPQHSYVFQCFWTHETSHPLQECRYKPSLLICCFEWTNDQYRQPRCKLLSWSQLLHWSMRQLSRCLYFKYLFAFSCFTIIRTCSTWLYTSHPCNGIPSSSVIAWKYKRQQVYSPGSIMNLDRLSERVRGPFWQPSWNSPLPATFSPWKWFQWIPWPPKHR